MDVTYVTAVEVSNCALSALCRHHSKLDFEPDPFTHYHHFRHRIFYGQTLQTFLQESGETIYMPNLVYHSVWNMSPTLSVSNNPLYESSFVEQIGSGRSFITEKIKSIQEEPYLKHIRDQLNVAIKKKHILNYRPPQILPTHSKSKCHDESYYNWSLLKRKRKSFSKRNFKH